MSLEDYYCGDEAYRDLIASLHELIEPYRSKWSGWPRLIVLCAGDEDIARGVFYVAGRNSLDWMQNRPPILDGLTPTECLASTNGQNRLKESILRYGGMA